jgi:hypothetical protein
LDDGVRREANAVASGFDEGANLLRGRRVGGRVREKNGEQGSV